MKVRKYESKIPATEYIPFQKYQVEIEPALCTSVVLRVLCGKKMPPEAAGATRLICTTEDTENHRGTQRCIFKLLTYKGLFEMKSFSTPTQNQEYKHINLINI